MIIIMQKFSKKIKKILFLIDIKNRDLPSSALIAYHLIKMKHKVFFQSITNPINNFGYPEIKFDAVIFPKFNNVSDSFKYSYLISKKKNYLTFCIENEGNQNYKNYKKFLYHPDVYFFWGAQQKKKYSYKNNVKKVLGSPRLDFFHPKFEKLADVNKIRKRLGLNKDTKIITVTTRTQEAHKIDKQINKIFQRRKLMYVEPKELFFNYYQGSKKILKTNINLIKKISKYYKNYKIVIKPHPNENLLFWEKYFYKNKNIIIAKNLFTHELLRISSFNISNNLCNTTLESQILNLPCLELQDNFSKKYSIKDHYNLPYLTAENSETAFKMIQKEINNKSRFFLNKLNNKKVKNYIKKYFFKFDGLRCKDYAKQINASLLKKVINKEITDKEKFLLKKLEEKLKKFDIKSKSLLYRVRNFFKKSVYNNYDNRGRYDHRYNLGDERIWYKKFEKINYEKR